MKIILDLSVEELKELIAADEGEENSKPPLGSDPLIHLCGYEAYKKEYVDWFLGHLL